MANVTTALQALSIHSAAGSVTGSTVSLASLGICGCKGGCSTNRCGCRKRGEPCDYTRCGCCTIRGLCNNLAPDDPIPQPILPLRYGREGDIADGGAVRSINDISHEPGLHVMAWNIQSFGGSMTTTKHTPNVRYTQQRDLLARTILAYRPDVAFVEEVMDSLAVTEVAQLLHGQYDSHCIHIGKGYNAQTQKKDVPEYMAVFVRRQFAHPDQFSLDRSGPLLSLVNQDWPKRSPVVLRPIRIRGRDRPLRFVCVHLLSESTANMLPLTSQIQGLGPLWTAVSQMDGGDAIPVFVGDFNREPSAPCFRPLSLHAGCGIDKRTNLAAGSMHTYDHIWVPRSWFGCRAFSAHVITLFPDPAVPETSDDFTARPVTMSLSELATDYHKVIDHYPVIAAIYHPLPDEAHSLVQPTTN